MLRGILKLNDRKMGTVIFQGVMQKPRGELCTLVIYCMVVRAVGLSPAWGLGFIGFRVYRV